MRRLPAAPPILAFLLAANLSLSLGDDQPAKKPPTGRAVSRDDARADDALTTTPAVACRSIEGYESYELLPDASLTAEEKLLVYYRPLNYHVEKVEKGYHVHLTQDGQVRRRGEKTVLLRKEKLLDYEFTRKDAPAPLYLRNMIGLKGLKPGDYEFDIILHDKTAEGEPTVTRTLAFKVVPVVLPKEEVEAESEKTVAPTPPPTKARAKSKKKSGRR